MERIGTVIPWLPDAVLSGYSRPYFVKDHSGGAPFLLETEYRISTLAPEARELFSSLLDRKELDQVIDNFISSLARRRRRSELQGLRNDMAGYLFEPLAYNYVQRFLREGEILLSPEVTSDLFRSIFPGREMKSEFGDSLGIEGITVPDGIILLPKSDEIVVVGMSEYTLSPRSLQKKKKQIEVYESKSLITSNLDGSAFRLAILDKYIKGLFPEFQKKVKVDYSKFRVVFAVPRGNEDFRIQNGQVVTLPFSGRDFNLIFEGVQIDALNALDSRSI